MEIKYVLCLKVENPLVPYRFWEWEIFAEGNIEKGWHPYEGNSSLIPKEMMDEISTFEKRIGKAIRRPAMFGDEKVIIGG